MKKKIAVISGGDSAESVISHQSADVVIKNIDNKIYDVYNIVIKGNSWILKRDNKEDIAIDKNDFSCIVEDKKIKFDCAFIIIHGTPGEDGKLQGYFDIVGIPYTTSDLHTCALTFNKYACNSFLKQNGILCAESVLIRKGENFNTKKRLSKIKLPCFVKPNNGGSSFGISKINNDDDFNGAIKKALEHDHEVLIEEFIDGIEITCGVVHHKDKPIVLPLTEIISQREFWDFEAKYEGESEEITPARISKDAENKCKEISSHIFNKLSCKGIVRFDYILKEDDFYLLELNTVPGLSENSVIPQQANAIGMSLEELFGLVIEGAINE